MKKLLIANWKMHPRTPKEARDLAVRIVAGVRGSKDAEVVLCPSFVHLSVVAEAVGAGGRIALGAQDVSGAAEKDGAFTGEVSAKQLRSLGARFVLIGHSERRALGETNEVIQRKLKTALEGGLHPVLCVGEREREKDVAFPPLVKEELHSALSKVKRPLFKKLVIAYEPVWAISSRHRGADTPRNVFEMSILIRRELCRIVGKKIAFRIPIIYGGSVDAGNAASFVKEGMVDGLLVGSASLDAKKFTEIAKRIS